MPSINKVRPNLSEMNLSEITQKSSPFRDHKATLTRLIEPHSLFHSKKPGSLSFSYHNREFVTNRGNE